VKMPGGLLPRGAIVSLGLVLIAWLATSVMRVGAQFPPAPGTGPGLPETIEAIDSARVTTRILYVTAHPDDESSSVLTYLARGLHADVALLSLTRGEGGQNDLGPEQAPQLGLIRTQELLAATRGYGVRLFFTRARDFGFSKTPEETEKIWGDEVLRDMVHVIRTFRPNVVINNFGGVHSGHGHHQTAGLWTPKALQLAADPSYRLPNGPAGSFDQQAWGDGQHIPVLDLERGSEHPQGFVIPMDEVSPLWGKSYREIGMDAFSNHHTQGITAFLASPFLRRPVGVMAEGGGAFDPKVLATSLSQPIPGCEKLSSADAHLAAARSAVLQLNFESAAAELAKGADIVSASREECEKHATEQKRLQELDDVVRVQRRIERALQLTVALTLDADAATGEMVAGEPLKIAARARCRTETACTMGDLRLVVPPGVQVVKRDGDAKQGFTFIVGVPRRAGPESESVEVSASTPPIPVADPIDPEPPPLITAEQSVSVFGYSFATRTPVTHVEASSTHAVRVPLRLVPAYTLSVKPKQAVEVLAKPGQPFDVLLQVHSRATQAGKVSAGLDVPQGWTASQPVALDFIGIGDRYARVTVTPPQKIDAGTYKLEAYARRGAEKFTESLEPLPTLPTQLWSETAECVVHAFDINVPDNLRVGYITAENEPVPEALERLGVRVEMLDPAALAFGDLSQFGAIVVGVRAYELRSDLPGANQRLLDYVNNGGTLVVQYERDFAWDRAQYAPYPTKIAPPAGRPLPRVTDEQSPVKFLKPDDPLLNRPNKITQGDFQGWVQERGLYFWTQYDGKYTPLLGMNDPGEIEQDGALVYARYGKGTYVYTGLAFFRQLPDGVPGAYRLFVNLLHASSGD
jgi:LmbE family N-acetylglucosaminyl deacetylase